MHFLLNQALAPRSDPMRHHGSHEGTNKRPGYYPDEPGCWGMGMRPKARDLESPGTILWVRTPHSTVTSNYIYDCESNCESWGYKV